MIVTAVLTLFAALFTFLLGALPDFEPPAWTMDGVSAIGEVFNSAALLGAWVPFGLVPPVLLAVAAALTAGFSIRFSRVVLSLFTGGGGAAG